MDSRSRHDVQSAEDGLHTSTARRRSSSHSSQASDDSHTALDFIRSQMQLEADAREALPYLLEQEETYEPPVSDDGGSNAEGVGPGSGSHGSGSLYERGESALRNVDRVRAIEGVMAYNHLKDKLKPFFQQFAESGQAISAEDIKSYFAKLRGDEQAIQEAGEGARSDDNRREQSGY
ncbi:hypothetical protein HMPREF1624_06711 [Sporothrix schenckii ATCC 58251]|uniref:Uncharacterized protein n=1 Tax=Sporothrix schenckii (strain ATCC 58251 / de Perez 2211183) TaxID=1391915 RepID=U7PRN9_SPOS1|nr:hypothetical protein HMPREF1624_06711 [Sporothrix schenckii ATCC 58251]